MVIAATWTVALFGLLIVTFCLYGMVRAGGLLSLVKGFFDQRWGLPVAIAVRLLMGAALLVVADRSVFPMAFLILGWIAIVAAVGLLFVGLERFRPLVAWMESLGPLVLRVWLLFGLAFGVFLLTGIRPLLS